MFATIDVVELGLSDGVINVDGGEGEFTLLGNLVESVDTSGGFFRNTSHILDDSSPSSGIFGDSSSQDGVEVLFVFSFVSGGVG